MNTSRPGAGPIATGASTDARHDPKSRRLCCHVVALSHSHDSILTIETQAGWLLPYFEGPSLPALLAPLETMLDGLTSRANIVHVAPLSREPSAIVQQCYALVCVGGPLRSDNVVLRSRHILSTGHALLPVQRNAVATALARLQSPQATFDTDVAVIAALDWAERRIAEQYGARLLATARHRCMRHDYVVRFETTAGTMYFKGGRGRIDDEAELTQMLWRLEPTQFPETVAIDRVHHRWLYRGLEGGPLTGSLLTKETVSTAVTALAVLQRRVMHEPAIRDLLRHRRMTARALLGRAEDSVRRATSSERNPAFDVDSWNAAVTIAAARCDAIDVWGLPMTLVLSDFWTQNTLWTPSGIGFIDVEHSYWSYPIISMCRFIHDVTRRPGMEHEARRLIMRAFADAWHDIIPSTRMEALIAQLPLLGALFGLLLASRDLDLDERALGSALAPDYRAQRLAPHMRQLHEEVRDG